MLRLARQRLGLTQKDASKRLGITQPLLSRFENSVSDPDDAFLIKAGRVYDMPRSFFKSLEPIYGPPVSIHTMLRSKADVTAREVDLITAELNLRVMHLRRLLEGVDFVPTSDIPSIDVEQFGPPEKIAATVRAHWGVPSGPIKNLVQIAERAGVIVGTSMFGGASVSGATFRVSGIPPIVLLNEQNPADRMRFTLAHELGHLVMHRFPTSQMEKEANEFASALLLPANEIRAALRGRKIRLEVLAALKPEWKVAMQALLMRVSALGLIEPNQSRYLWQKISAHGWRLREPPELDFPREVPGVLPSIIKSHLNDLGYSGDELANFLRIHKSEFDKVYGVSMPDEPQKPRLRIVG